MFTITSVIGRFFESVDESHHRRRHRDRREQITQFCRGVLIDGDEGICRIIDDYDLSSLVQINVVEETFEDTFRRVCVELFKIRSVGTSYITAIFVYASKLNEYHLVHSKAWYQTDLLMYSLVDILEEKAFNPCTLTYRYSLL